MPFYPTLTESYTSQQVVDEFGGYNHNMKIGEGEFYHMENLTSDYYPLLANRRKRGTVAQLTAPSAVLGKSQMAYIDGTELWYGDTEISTYLEAKGFVISDDESMMPKQLISMGAYIVIYPDKLYINTENYTDCGSMEAHFSTAENSAVQFSICKADGTAYASYVISATAPIEPENGDLWIDSSGLTHVLKQYSDVTASWANVPTVYTKISYAGIGASFALYDGVCISGCTATSEDSTSLQNQIAALNGSKIIYGRDDGYIVVTGLLDQTFTQSSGSVSIARTVPDMDFITESNNRLWGCKYGLVNGETVNEIYCCALGDFKNWEQFQGISTDSYRASVGTDGPWTGAVTHLGYPIFFKENCLHKVYISSTGAHQIVDTACRGVQKGSHNSLAVVNETLFYKSTTDVCAYDGSLPQSVSTQFGTERYFDAVGGSLGDKYYISMRDARNMRHLFVLDTLRGFWYREDDTNALQFARCDGELYYINGDNHKLMCITGSAGTLEESFEWAAETGLIGYMTVERKYISRFNLRMKLPVGSSMKLFIQYDSDGEWNKVGEIHGTGTNTFMIPVRPRRCDHFRIRLEGIGDVRLYSFAKILEVGSDVT